MEKLYGKVVEVYIPNEYKDNMLLDVMDRTLIGFKIEIDNRLYYIEQKQDEFNTKIRKDDEVIITKQIIDGKEFIDIEGV